MCPPISFSHHHIKINNTDNCHFALVYLLVITRLTFTWSTAQEPSIYELYLTLNLWQLSPVWMPHLQSTCYRIVVTSSFNNSIQVQVRGQKPEGLKLSVLISVSYFRRSVLARFVQTWNSWFSRPISCSCCSRRCSCWWCERRTKSSTFSVASGLGLLLCWTYNHMYNGNGKRLTI